MSNHFHILLEVTPVPEGGIPDEVLLERLGVFYGEAQVKSIQSKKPKSASAGILCAGALKTGTGF